MKKFETPPDSPPIIIIDPDDQPMWSSTRTVAPTPSSAIVQFPISNNFRIKGTHMQMIRDNQFDGRIRSDPHRHVADFLEISNLFQYGENQEEARLYSPTQGILDADNTPNEAFQILEDKVLLKLDFSGEFQISPKTVVSAGGSNIDSYHAMLMEKFEDLITKIDSEFLIIRKKLKEMRDGRRDNHASQIYMKDDTSMCEPHEANYVQIYHGGYHDHEPINSYSYPNHNSHLSRYFEFTKTSTEEMMKEWMASQMKANERTKNQVVELENQINQGLRNHQAIIQNLERQFEFLLPTKTLSLPTNTKPRHEIVYNIPSIQNDNDKGDVKFIKEEETETNPTMPNQNLIMSISPTVSPFLKDCTVHILYTQEKVFEHDEISNHVGDKELISFVGIENEMSKGNIEGQGDPNKNTQSIFLREHDIVFRANSNKETPKDFLIEAPPEDNMKELGRKMDTKLEEMKPSCEWKLYTDGASSSDGSGAGLILIDPKGKEYTYALRFEFETTNNEAEYEALLARLRIVQEMETVSLAIFVDSQLLVKIKGIYAAKQPAIKEYLQRTKETLRRFRSYIIEHIRRNQKKKADALSKLASMTFEHLTTEVETKEEESWMTPIYEYLLSGLLPQDSRKIRIKAPQYKLIRGSLYKKSFYTPWLRCIAPPKTDDVIKEIHEGSCSFNTEPRSMVVRITKQGYYWPSMHRDIARIIQDYEKCKEQYAMRKRAEIRAITTGNAWPFSHWRRIENHTIFLPHYRIHGDNKQNRQATNSRPTRMGARFTSVESNVVKDDRGRTKEVTKRKESKEVALIEEAYYQNELR
ncbi:reverse transcriptase domain-containing protein, partial [Tanacetum coccineum]